MASHPLVEKAEQIATEAHAGQYRRGGVIPYIEHPRSVVGRVGNDPEAQVVAWLHDVIEDTDVSADELVAAGIPADLVDAVVILTKIRELSYNAYLDQVAASPLATRVKIADMISNLADHPTQKQVRKYAQGLYRLTRDW